MAHTHSHKTEGLHSSENTVHDTMKIYSDWTNYDKDLLKAKYNGPPIAAISLSQVLHDKNARILDVCAGTGMVGQELHKLGFTNMDALDGCQEMLDGAKPLNIYKNFICSLFTHEPQDIPTDTYDALICVGSFVQGHLEVECIPEMIRLVKPGGIVLLLFRAEVMEKTPKYVGKLEPCIGKLEKEGAWELIRHDRIPNYYMEKDGALFIHKVLISEVKSC